MSLFDFDKDSQYSGLLADGPPSSPSSSPPPTAGQGRNSSLSLSLVAGGGGGKGTGKFHNTPRSTNRQATKFCY